MRIGHPLRGANVRIYLKSERFAAGFAKREKGGLLARTALINCVRGTVEAVGGQLPANSTPAFAAKVAPHVPAAF